MVRNEHLFNQDLWAGPMDTLDVHIPTRVLRSKSSKSLKESFNAIWENALNNIKNFTSMRELAKTGSFTHVPRASPWSLQVLRTRSTADAAWVAPLRATLLDTYTRAYTALAAGDAKTLKRLTLPEFAAAARAALPAPPGAKGPLTYKWRLHKLTAPAQIVSIRAVTAHYGLTEPITGNRLLVNALVRIESEQTLHVYDRTGALVRGVGQTAPRRVVEYLVFEKRMWYEKPWIIRERMYETS
ncbi:hypothetical protein BV25DRAFT_1819963 [Artomyces pyxidatus]|uniref:Uncharacterized protein n=1 Tax=Artomyces pyxidatus TaxID=48021 RepID=A0ACB8TEJ8_9AGAM|nr:hypothetical protein BV25DRAFT_1819963 [Artomyces pyxidatus]